jgi:hypothetical protein
LVNGKYIFKYSDPLKPPFGREPAGIELALSRREQRTRPSGSRPCREWDDQGDLCL